MSNKSFETKTFLTENLRVSQNKLIAGIDTVPKG